MTNGNSDISPVWKPIALLLAACVITMASGGFLLVQTLATQDYVDKTFAVAVAGSKEHDDQEYRTSDALTTAIRNNTTAIGELRVVVARLEGKLNE